MNKRVNWRRIALALGVCALTLGAAGRANAFFIRQAGMECFSKGFPQAESGFGGVILMGHSSEPLDATVYCPYPETNTSEKTGVNLANIHARGFATTSGIEGTACIGFWSAEGGLCAAPKSATGTQINVSLGRPSVWGSADGHFAYVKVKAFGYIAILKGLFFSS
jgi:hypothetical protein